MGAQIFAPSASEKPTKTVTKLHKKIEELERDTDFFKTALRKSGIE